LDLFNIGGLCFDGPCMAESTRTPPSPDGGYGAFAYRVFITVGITVLVAITLVLLWQALYVLLLIFGGILLAVLLRAMSDPLSHYTGISEGWSLAIVMVVLVGLMVGAGFLIAPRVAEQMDELTEQLPRAVDRIKERIVHYEWTHRLLKQAPEAEQLIGDGGGLGMAGGAMAQATGLLVTTLEGIIYVVVILFVAIYVAVDPELYLRGIVRLVPVQHRLRAREVLDEIGYTLRWWLIGRLIAMTAVGLLTWIGLAIVGVPLALTLGILAGLLDFIPNIGPWIAAVPGVLLALMESPEKAIYTAIVYAVVQQVESFLITPIIQQKAIHMPPALTITVQVLMGLMAGILGLTLATPLAAALIVLVQMLYVRNTLGDPIPKPSEDTS
jgi:predicted PurR-regulated permease PerM